SNKSKSGPRPSINWRRQARNSRHCTGNLESRMRINPMSSKSFSPSWRPLSLWLAVSWFAVPSARAFNNDVHTDIVIHNNSTGFNTVLTMNTTNYTGQLPIAQNVGGLNWKIVASGD